MRYRPLHAARHCGAYLCPARDPPPFRPALAFIEERKTQPATVPGTEHGGCPGVLRFDFPGYGGEKLQPISWDDWFKTFDERSLAFVVQEHQKAGNLSIFFRLDNPEREDA